MQQIGTPRNLLHPVVVLNAKLTMEMTSLADLSAKEQEPCDLKKHSV
jgi:hypothetical protein